ncbi:Pre-mRNA-splicing factor ISY1 [Balamuthia mandrillaris]
MARNEEKAQSMLNRWWQLKQETEKPKKPKKRPYLASLCRNVVECEKWRLEILREIGKKVAAIQNAALGEYKLRELNDEINKLIREKRHWERRILELGGPNYLGSAPHVGEDQGKEVQGGKTGYRYFGAARDLPGVKDLFVEQPEEAIAAAKKTRQELYQGVDADYFGFRGDDDGALEALEAEAEKKALEEAMATWHNKQAAEGGAAFNLDESIYKFEVPTSQEIAQALAAKHQ